MTFDTTYRTNLYDMLFGLFVGVNNHYQSIIFAGVLMRDEQEEIFEWVFEEFVGMMGEPPPKTILTGERVQQNRKKRYCSICLDNLSSLSTDLLEFGMLLILV